MKRKLFPTFVILMLLFALIVPGSVFAQTSGAYNTPFITSITYQNVGSAEATISVDFYNATTGAKVTTFTPAKLAKGAGTSLYIGSVSGVQSGFQGSAVMSSDQPLIATMVQLPQGSSSVKNRPLSNAFSGGSNSVLIATVLKNKFGSHSIISVQNVGSSPTDLTVNFYNADVPSNAPIQQTVSGLAAGAAKYFDMGKIGSVIPDNFNGSATITASSGGLIVASVLELSISGTNASSFEGVATGANTVYMPSALCNSFNNSAAYAVQNTSTTASADVVVNYSNGKSESHTIAAGTKYSFVNCNANPAGFSGSATITSTGAPIVAIGKVSGAGASTAFVGATAGADNLALPYVRYTQTQWTNGGRQRANIAIQNVGADLPAGAITIKYLDKSGNVVGTDTINTAVPRGGKTNSNPTKIGAAGNEFGYYSDGTFGGSAIVSGPAGSQLVAVVRISSFVPATNQTVAEDYNGVPFTAAP